MPTIAKIIGLLGLSLLSGVRAGDGKCNGEIFQWPVKSLCYALAPNTQKSWHCMWWTMEKLSGWPHVPRQPNVTCDDITWDCDSSLICSAMLEYDCYGPTECWGTPSDRKVVRDCILRKCPVQAEVGEKLIKEKRGQCNITGYSPLPAQREPTLWHGMRLNEDVAAVHWPSPALAASALVAAGTAFVTLAVFVGIVVTRRLRARQVAITRDSSEEELSFIEDVTS